MAQVAKYWETTPGGAEDALVQLKKKFDEKKCDKYIFNVDLMLPPVYFDLVQCLLENAKPFTSKELGQGKGGPLTGGV